MKRVCTVLVAVVVLWSSATAAVGGTKLSNKLRVDSTALGEASLGQAYNATLSAVGGTQPYTWSLVGGSLPPGLGVSSAGVISGTPEGGSGVWFLTFRVTDAEGHTARRSLSIFVVAGLPQSSMPAHADESR